MKGVLASLRGRDFLDISDLDPEQLRDLLALAGRIKSGQYSEQPLRGRFVAMVFQKPSARTRVSFEVGIGRLGGTPVTLAAQDVQLGVRETYADAARVFARYVDAIVARLNRHGDLVELAQAAGVPVINGLTDRSHPCQVLGDLLTLEELGGGAGGRKVAYVGDGNNIAHSLIEASALLGFPLTVITPPSHRPQAEVVEAARALSRNGFRLELTSDLRGVEGASAVYTDTWTSMGQEDEREERRKVFIEYQVNEALMEMAPGAVFMHCLPAHRGEEVTDAVIDGPRSVVFDQAANRLYAQMALMAVLI